MNTLASPYIGKPEVQSIGSSPKQSPKPEIPSQIDLLQGEMEMLDKAVSSLGTRLAPVSRQEPVLNQTGEAPKPKTTSLGESLAILCGAAYRIRMSVEDIDRRLEI